LRNRFAVGYVLRSEGVGHVKHQDRCPILSSEVKTHLQSSGRVGREVGGTKDDPGLEHKRHSEMVIWVSARSGRA
jgi:hypothetical protein